MINENRELWLERVKNHLEKLLDKAKRDNEIHNKMAKHHAHKERISRGKLKAAMEKIETLTKQREGDKLEIIVEASLMA